MPSSSLWKQFRAVPYHLVVLVADLSLICLAYVFAYRLRFFYQPFQAALSLQGIPSFGIYIQAMPAVLGCWAFAIIHQGAYGRLQVPATDEFLRFMKISIIGALLSLATMFLFRAEAFSRVVFLIGGISSFVFLYAWRQTLKILYVRWVRAAKQPRRVLVLGSGYLATSIKRMLDRLGDRAVLKKNTVSLEEIRKTIARSRINEVLLANTKMSHPQTVELAAYCEERGVMVRLLPDILEIRMGEVLIDDSLGIPTFQLKPVSLHGTAFIAKRIFDVAVASLLLGILFVPLTVLAGLIKMTSRGSVFFKQERVGFRGRHFKFIKFRTMIKDAEAVLEDLKRFNERPGLFKMKNDPRITSIGRFLRRFSIDEIPQFLNVLRGEMSLVGPRPQIPWETQGNTEWARKRLNVLPGITGLWQVSGRAELSYDEMIDLDIYYIEHWSAGLDFKILLRTLPAILVGKGAY